MFSKPGRRHGRIAAVIIAAIGGITAGHMATNAVYAQEPEQAPPEDHQVTWSLSGLVRYEAAFKTTSDENIVNQRGNPFNGVEVQRDSTALGGGPDTVIRNGEPADNDWNLMQLRTQLDLSAGLTPNLRFFGRLRGIYDLAPYDEFDPDAVGSQAAGFNYQEPEYFEYDSFNNGGSQNLLEIAGEKFMIDLPSFYLDYQRGPLLVRVGQQQIAWGQALFFRVLDVPNGLDLRRHLFLDYAPEEYADERIGSPAIRTTWQATQEWEVDAFVQKFQPTIYPNANTPYNAIASQFTIRDRYDDYDDKLNTGLRLRGSHGQWSTQFVAARRYNPDGVFRWTESQVNRDLPDAPGSGAVLQDTAFEVDSTGVQSAREWFTFAGNARLDGLEGLNASITEFPAAALLGAAAVPTMDLASAELDLFFQLSGGLRGHLAREYMRETNLGAGVGYVFNAGPGSLLDQLIVNFEASFTPDRKFTNTTLSRDYIEEDEWITALVVEKYQRFSQHVPATYLVFQWMHRTESDLYGRHLSGMGGSADMVAPGVSGGWNGLVFALQQPSPTLTWRFDGALLYDTRGGLLVQPALKWSPNTKYTVEAFYNFLDGDIGGADPNENIIQTLEYGDELGIRIAYQF
ncbi:DUF1302 family protein [Panacagrimonas sp.]|uniref:DUF1302 family protein n=1 Tax=Panacagrimonas sp. TaxID=2480088 RepID=UPI003B5289BC